MNSSSASAVGPKEIFPLEVWNVIFQHLQDCDDLINCTKASKVWRDFLEPFRATYLFQKVISLLVERDGEIDFLECRRVCKRWKFAVDEFLQKHPSHMDDCLNYYSGIAYTFQPWFRAAESPEMIQEYLQRMTLSHQPFVTRGIGIEDTLGGQEETPEFWKHLKNLLGIFGKEIWHCNLALAAVSPESGQLIYNNMCAVLQLMPNLMSLRLSVLGMEVPGVPPHLSLTKLILLECVGATKRVVNELITSCEHSLERLDVGENEPGDTEVLRLSLLRKIKVLRVSDTSLSQPQSVQWPLHTLRLTLNFGREHHDLQQIFRSLEQFSTTLHCLSVEIYDDETNPAFSSHDLRLNVKCLQELKIVFGSSVLLDCILPLTSLQCLNVVLLKDEITAADKVINFVGYFSFMSESNIWELLPNLKTLRCNVPNRLVDAEPVDGRQFYFYRRKGTRVVST